MSVQIEFRVAKYSNQVIVSNKRFSQSDVYICILFSVGSYTERKYKLWRNRKTINRKTQWTIELLTRESRFCTHTVCIVSAVGCRMHINITFSSNFKVHTRCEWMSWAWLIERVIQNKPRWHWLSNLCWRECARANIRLSSTSFACKYFICNLWSAKQIQLKSIDFQFFFSSFSSLLPLVYCFLVLLWFIFRVFE